MFFLLKLPPHTAPARALGQLSVVLSLKGFDLYGLNR